MQLRRRGVSQTFRFGPTSVSVTTRDLLRRSAHVTTDYFSLAKHPTALRTANRSNWWLFAGLALSVGAVVNTVQGAYSFADVVVSTIFCGGLIGWWCLGRARYRGYAPIFAFDIGVRTDAVLDNLQKRRVAFVVGRIAMRDPGAALQLVAELTDEGMIDAGLAADLVHPPSGEDDYRPGTYL